MMKYHSNYNFYKAVTYSSCLFLLFLNIWFFWKSGGFWRDEISTASFCKTENVAQCIDLMKYNTIPILLPILLHGIGVFYPFGDLLLKIIALTIGVIPLILTATFILKNDPRFAAIFSILNLAFDFSIRWIDSLRGYGLGFVTLLLFLWFLRRSRSSNIWTDRIFLILFAAMSIISSYQNWPLVLMGIGLNVLYMIVMKKVGWVSFSMIAIATCLITIIPHLTLLHENAEIFKTMRLDWMSTIDILARFINLIGGVFRINISICILIICVIIAYIFKRRASLWFDNNAILDIVYLIFGLVSCLFVIDYSKYLPYEWHFVIPLLFASFQISCLWEQFVVPNKLEKLLIATFWLALVFGSLPTLNYLRKKSTNVEMIADFLIKHSSPDDLILISPWESAISVRHYYSGPASIISVPPISQFDTNRFDEVAKFMISNPEPFFQVLSSKIREALGKGRVIWLIGDLMLPAPGVVPLSIGPAPSALWGWMSAPYYRMWGEKLGFILLSSASSGSVCTPEVDGTNLFLPYEHQQLYKFNGLKSP